MEHFSRDFAAGLGIEAQRATVHRRARAHRVHGDAGLARPGKPASRSRPPLCDVVNDLLRVLLLTDALGAVLTIAGFPRDPILSRLPRHDFGLDDLARVDARRAGTNS
jgi:hypothetical protein